jgi:phenylacetate-CoA ligase
MPLAGGIAAPARDFARAAWRQGRVFHALLAELGRTERLSPPDLAAHGLSNLRAVLIRAGRHVPFYREALARSGLDPARIHSLADLARLPLIDKAVVRSRPEDFRDRSVRFTVRGYTSGTTGTPLVVHRDLASVIHEHAIIWRQRSWFDVKPGERLAVLRGEVVTPAACTTPPFWRHDRFAHELLLSSHHLAAQNARAYHDALVRFAPAALYAYPSAAAELARLFRDQRLAPPPLRAVFTASETLRPEDAALIARVFRAPVVDRYGNAERTLAGGHCERGGYHLWTDVTLLELLPTRNDRAELVGTPLFGHAMPLLRYRTGDEAVVPAAPCPCGRAFPVVARIEGRLDPLVVTRDGRRIGRLDHVWKGLTHVAAGQIVQEADLTVRLRVVPEPGYAAADRAAIEAHARERLGPDLPIVIEEVDRLPRTPAGKFLAVVSRVPAGPEDEPGPE